MSNIDIKVGDKLFSKKSSEFIVENKYYTIVEMTSSSGISETFLTSFVLNEPNHENYIWNYFYTPNELRKEKINKLNE